MHTKAVIGCVKLYEIVSKSQTLLNDAFGAHYSGVVDELIGHWTRRARVAFPCLRFDPGAEEDPLYPELKAHLNHVHVISGNMSYHLDSSRGVVHTGTVLSEFGSLLGAAFEAVTFIKEFAVTAREPPFDRLVASNPYVWVSFHGPHDVSKNLWKKFKAEERYLDGKRKLVNPREHMHEKRAAFALVVIDLLYVRAWNIKDEATISALELAYKDELEMLYPGA